MRRRRWPPSRWTIDNDNKPASWKVFYDAGARGNGETASPDNGKRVYTLTDRNGVAQVARRPEWALNNDEVYKYDYKSGLRTVAQDAFFKTTASLVNKGIDANAGNSADNYVAVGTDYDWVSKQYNLSYYSLTHFAATEQFTLANVTNDAQRDAVGALYPSGSAWLGMIYSHDTGTLYYDVSYASYSSNYVSWYGGTTSYNNWNSGEPNNSGFEYAVEQYFANDRFNDLNGYDQRWFVYETGNRWDSSTVRENFYDYHYDWTSTNTAIMQARYELEYQWVSNETAEFDNRPKFRTYNTQTKVVDTAKKTLYRDEAITQTVTETRTVRLEGGAGGATVETFGTFGANSVGGRDVEIVSGRDTRLSGNLETDRNLSITSARDFRLGETPEGVDPATYMPTTSSQMLIGGTLTIDAERGIETDLASLITVTGTTLIDAAKDIDLKGDLVAGDAVTVTSGDTINAFGKLQGTTVALLAGTDGRGSVLTALRTDIDAANLTITAGNVDGDITFRDSAVNVTGIMTLTATAGGLYASGNTDATPGATAGNHVMANKAIMTARDGVQSDQGGAHAFLLAASTLTVNVSDAGPIWIRNEGNLDLIEATTFEGDVRLSVTGNLIARSITAGASAQNAITLATPSPVGGARDSAGLALRNIQVGTLAANTVEINAATNITQRSNSVVTADTLTLVSNEGITLSGLAVGTIDARVEGVGDMALTTLAASATNPGDLNVIRLVTQDGLIALNSERNVVLSSYAAGTSGVVSGVVAGRSADRTPQSSDTNPVVDLAGLVRDTLISHQIRFTGKIDPCLLA